MGLHLHSPLLDVDEYITEIQAIRVTGRGGL
jgi:hypothetical protein